jgi:hypothetical protein
LLGATNGAGTLLDELAQDFAAVGNPEAVAAIREWQRLAKQMSGRKRSDNSRQPPPHDKLLMLPPE